MQGISTTYFLGCQWGDKTQNADGSYAVSFTAGTVYPAGCDVCQIPSGATIQSLSIVFDEQGWTHLDDIRVGDFFAGGPGHSD